MLPSAHPHRSPAESDRDAALRQYGALTRGSAWRRLRATTKRMAWVAVVESTRLIKRLVDIVGCLVLIPLLAPALLVVAALIKIDSPGPVFFRQTRIGRWGVPFSMHKLRSMYVDAEARKTALQGQNEMAGGVIFKMKRDPRITRVGRFIRRGSIDEMPQLWNVLKGEMSLVGPRPHPPSEVAQYSLADRRRLDVIPGITCVWQVSGRSNIPFPQQVELDVGYIESQTLWGDLKLLLRTIPAVFLGRGAY